jgi:Mg-chelatase subunit ChlD
VPDTPTPTARVLNTPTPTFTATPGPTATWTAVATATPTPTATATRRPAPVYLPLALREECVPAQRRVDVALVIDASTSMTELTDHGTKLDAARAAARTFLGEVNLAAGDQAAIIAFNGGVTLLSDLTSDRDTLLAALDQITVGSQTRIHRGVQAAQTALTGPYHRPGNALAMVVLTDGRANPDSPELAVQAAAQAKAVGITVFTVGLGAELDFLALQRMASKREYFYEAPDAGQLEGIYREIAVMIPCPPEAFWGRR